MIPSPLNLIHILLPCLVLGSNSGQAIPIDQECAFPNAVYTMPGDIAFMGIFNLHAGESCSEDHGPEFDTLQGVIQTVNRMNRLGNTVHGVDSIGLHVYDACSTGNKAEKAMVNALFDMDCSHTYSLGLLTTSAVSHSLASIISNLHLPTTILDNTPPLDLPLLFNATFSFLQSVQITHIHVALLPGMGAMTSFSNLATTYRMCVNNPLTYRHIEDSKDKIEPHLSEFSTAVLVGTLEEYAMHAAYLTSVSGNLLFIPTNLDEGLSTKYFETMKNGTYVVSPHLYDSSKSSSDKGTTKQDNQHSFISKLNQNYEFNIDMKFVRNSLKIHHELDQFRTKFNADCADKPFGNCTDLKPLLSNGNTRKGKSDYTIDEFINAFQVENAETSIDGVYVYRVFKSEEDTHGETAQATAQQSTVEDTLEGIDDAKKKLLLDINNTNWENMGKRDLILSSIHIVTSEAYDKDMLNIERNDEHLDQDELEKVEYHQKDDLGVNDLNETDATSNTTTESDNDWTKGGTNRELVNETQEDSLDLKSESMEDNFEANNSRKLDDPLQKLVGRYERTNEERDGNDGYNILMKSVPLKTNETSETQTNEDNTDTTHPITNRKIQPQMKPDDPFKTNNPATNHSGERRSRNRPVRSVSKSTDDKILIESIGKYSYVNNTWLIVLNEDDTLREGNEQFLCRVISVDSDNETTLGQGQDCSSCFNFREIYQLIELNKKEFEESRKRIVDIVFKVQLKTDSFTVVIISLSAMGVIACVVILGFILYRIFQRDVLEGNPTITILLLLSIMYNYVVITPFVVNIDPTIEYVDYYSHLLCYIRLISIITSFNFIFSLLLTRCLMLSFCDHDGALMSHINGYIQSSFCFFITIIQILNRCAKEFDMIRVRTLISGFNPKNNRI
uniref:Protein bride of sevenless n=1 Tax=Cacopsylla melanoneura TaxID=428564 RepID=A0A8D8Z1F1_9HEMI